MGQAYTQVLQDNKVLRVAGVADIRPEAARAMAEANGCAAWTSCAGLAEEGGIDAAIVCTPPSTHLEICGLFLSRGISVLCEKPLAINVASARRAFAVAREYGSVLAMASKFRYVEDVVKARSILTSGMLGEVCSVRNVFCAPVDMSNRWNSNPEISGGGVLIDNGTHSVDLVRYLVGPIRKVLATEGKRLHGLAVEESVHLVTRADCGVLACVDLSWNTPDPGGDYLQIACSSGCLNIGWKGSAYRRTPGTDWIPFGQGYNKFNAMRRLVENFGATLKGEEPLRISEQDALESVSVISVAYRSLRSGEWQTVPPLMDAMATSA
jgi:predicted dehydrogenase